jgi:hypothetical protein
MLDRIVAELGQGPAAVRKADHRGRLVGESAESGSLVGGDPRRCSAPVAAAHPAQSLTVEGLQVGLGRVGVEGEEARDGGSVPALGAEHDGFGAAQLPTVGGGLQELAQLPELSRGGAAAGQCAGHGRTSEGEGQPPIVPRVM